MRKRFARKRLVVATALLVSAFFSLPLRGDIVPNPAHNWDANLDTNGNATWEDIGTLANRPWSLTGPAGPQPNGPIRTGVNSGGTTITHAFSFDGTDDAGQALNENRAGNHDTTFELWFRPSTFPVGSANTGSVLFEHGNGPRGITIGMSGSHVYFIYRANPDAGVLSFNLDPTGQGSTSSTFTQVVAVLDDSANQMRLYVAGTSVGQLAIGASSDFTSNDDLGLAANAGQGGGGQESSLIAWNIPFHGDLAIIREYRLAFTETEATQNYLAVNVPEPAVSLLLFLVMLFHARRRQRLG